MKTRAKYSPLIHTEKEAIGFNLPTPPLLNDNQLIFFSTEDNNTTYSIYDISTSRFSIQSQAIECDHSFDISNTVYALNPNNNTIYFIENNKDIQCLHLPQNAIQSLNKSIHTAQGNKAQIVYNKGTVYIIGAEEKSDDSDEYICIPYATAPPRCDKPLIAKSGAFARVIHVESDGTNNIYMMGGINEDSGYPTNNIWCLELLGNEGDHQWMDRSFFTDQARHSFGVINYKNEYLIGFGGTELDKRISTVEYIWFLPLVQNENAFEMGHWYEMYLKLPKKSNYHAIYAPDETLHLFDYEGGHYVVKMEDILNAIHCREYLKKRKWTDQPKTVLPTRALSVEAMSPKKTPVQILLESLGDEYKGYWDSLDDKGYTTLDKIINDPDGCLGDVVKDEEHRNKIIKKAKDNK